jgi:S-DNA-T family DNA segregation ATPase FtsK/SpoIIIE
VRIAQLGRAAGVHLLVATQRPDATVLPGQLRSNLASRWVFRTASAVDSRVALGDKGAESLLGRGDFLLSSPGYPRAIRGQAPMINLDYLSPAT